MRYFKVLAVKNEAYSSAGYSFLGVSDCYALYAYDFDDNSFDLQRSWGTNFKENTLELFYLGVHDLTKDILVEYTKEEFENEIDKHKLLRELVS